MRATRFGLAASLSFALLAGLSPPAVAAAPTSHWTMATRLNDLGTNGTSPDLVVAEDGTAVAVWIDSEPTRLALRSRQFSPSGGWLPVTTLWYGSALGLPGSLKVAGNRAGDAVAAWILWNGTGQQIGVAHYMAGWGWSLARQASSTGSIGGNTWDPGVAINEFGDAIVAWVTYNGTALVAAASRFNSGVGWLAEQTVAALSNGSGYDVAATIDNSRVATVIWGENNGTDENLWASRNTSASAWGPRQLAFQYPYNGPSVVWTGYVQFIAASAGEVVGALEVYDGQTGRTTVWQAGYNGAWAAASPLSDPGLSAYIPRLKMAPNGTAVVSFSQNGSIVVKTRAPASAWSAAVEVSGAVPYTESGVGAGSGGHLVVVWKQLFLTRAILVARVYSPAAGWSNLTPVDSLTPFGAAGLPAAGVDPDGNGLAAWVNSNATITAPFAARFLSVDGTPPPLLLAEPADNAVVGSPLLWVSGSTEAGARVWVNGWEAAVSSTGGFGVFVPLVNGTNAVEARAADASGNDVWAWANVTFIDPLGGQLANLSARDAQLGLDLAALNASLAQAISDAVAAQQAALDALSAGFNATAAELRAAVDAARASLGNTDANVSGALLEVAGLAARLDLLAGDLNLTRDQLDARLAAISDDLNATRAEFDARMDGAGANATGERARVDAALAALEALLNGTRQSLATSDANLTAAVARLDAADTSNGAWLNDTRSDLAATGQRSDAAQGLVTLAFALGLAGLAAGVVASLLALKGRRPPPAARAEPASQGLDKGSAGGQK